MIPRETKSCCISCHVNLLNKVFSQVRREAHDCSFLLADQHTELGALRSAQRARPLRRGRLM